MAGPHVQAGRARRAWRKLPRRVRAHRRRLRRGAQRGVTQLLQPVRLLLQLLAARVCGVQVSHFLACAAATAAGRASSRRGAGRLAWRHAACYLFDAAANGQRRGV